MDTKESSFNRDFIYTIPSRVLFDNNITDLDRKIYMVIRSFMDTTGDCYPSNAWFAEKFGVEKRSIPRSLDRLIKFGYIKRVIQNERRFLLINQVPFKEEGMTSGSPPHDPSVTPPMTLGSSNTSSNNSISNIIKTSTPPSESLEKYQYQETLYPVKPTNKKQISKSDSLSLQQIIFALPFCIDLQVIEDWLKVRKSKRAPITATALKLLLNELELFKNSGIDPAKKFEEMVANGWSSIKFSWSSYSKGHGAPKEPFYEKRSGYLKDLGKTPFDGEVINGF